MSKHFGVICRLMVYAKMGIHIIRNFTAFP